MFTSWAAGVRVNQCMIESTYQTTGGSDWGSLSWHILSLSRRTRESWDSVSFVGYLPLFILGLPVLWSSSLYCGLSACTVGNFCVLWASCQYCGLFAYSVGYLPVMWATCLVCGLPACSVGFLPDIWFIWSKYIPWFLSKIQFLTSCLQWKPEILQQLTPLFLSSPLTLHFTWERAYGLSDSDSTAYSHWALIGENFEIIILFNHVYKNWNKNYLKLKKK